MIEYLPDNFKEKINQKLLMVSISGIRAIVPNGLTPDMIVQLLNAYALTTKGTILIGNDGRISSPVLEELILAVLSYYGKTIIQLGIAPTPTIKAACNFYKVDSGIIITASHNPIEWNGIKFLKKGGMFYTKADYITLFKAMSQKENYAPVLKRNIILKDGIEKHIESIAKVIPNIETVRKRKYKVLVDLANGSGVYAIPKLLEFFNCKVIKIHSEANRPFERPPEPTPENLKLFSKLCKQEKVQIGFALDPDGDRLVCGSPLLGAINEEYTLPLAYLGKKLNVKKPMQIVINYSTSSLLERICQFNKDKVIRTSVGEVNVFNKILEIKAKFGGEGNGGVIDPIIPSRGRDSLAGISYILSAMAEKNANSVDDLIQTMPPLYMAKLKLFISKKNQNGLFDQIYQSLKALNKTIVQESKEDGYYIAFEDSSWVHFRFSNTEPIMRIIFEEASKEMFKKTQTFFQNLIQNI